MFRINRLSFATFALALLAFALPMQARAQGGCTNGGSGGCTSVPEVDPSLGSGGLALVAGAVMVVRGRRR